MRVAVPVEISYQGKQRTVAVPVAVEEEPPLRGMGPLQAVDEAEEVSAEELAEHAPTVTVVGAAAPESDDLVMLVRPRKSRIYYLRKFFDYPIKLSGTTVSNLGAGADGEDWGELCDEPREADQGGEEP